MQDLENTLSRVDSVNEGAAILIQQMDKDGATKVQEEVDSVNSLYQEVLNHADTCRNSLQALVNEQVNLWSNSLYIVHVFHLKNLKVTHFTDFTPPLITK